MRIPPKVPDVKASSALAPVTVQTTVVVPVALADQFGEVGSAAAIVPLTGGARAVDVLGGDWWQGLQVPPRKLAIHTSQTADIAGQAVEQWLS
jgi:hypothetical protein